MRNKAKRAEVWGKVQGVGFRWSARTEAQRLGLTGFVRNRADGAVETQFEGTDAAIGAFVSWLNHGPPGATVSSVDVEEAEPAGGASFEVLT